MAYFALAYICAPTLLMTVSFILQLSHLVELRQLTPGRFRVAPRGRMDWDHSLPDMGLRRRDASPGTVARLQCWSGTGPRRPLWPTASSRAVPRRARSAWLGRSRCTSDLTDTGKSKYKITTRGEASSLLSWLVTVYLAERPSPANKPMLPMRGLAPAAHGNKLAGWFLLQCL